MAITNKHKLPQCIVDLCKSDSRPVDWHSYSVTEIIGNVREIILKRRHGDELEQDVSDMTNLIFGTAVHDLLEKHDKTGMAELSLKQEIFTGYFLKGRVDLYDQVNYKIVDYKTATVNKVLKQDFADYDKQGSIYSWMALKDQMLVASYEFIIFLKDWNYRDKLIAEMQGDPYPESAIYVYNKVIDSSDISNIQEYIYNKFKRLIAMSGVSDNDLMDCENVGYTGDIYAVYKTDTDTRASKLFDNQIEADGYANKIKGVVKLRKGERKKCQYCVVKIYCDKEDM